MSTPGSDAPRREARIEETRAAIFHHGVILAVRLGGKGGVTSAGPGDDFADEVVSVCRAAARGGIRVMEVTLTTPRATEAIRRLADDSGLVVGAGTVLRVADVQAVADAGGRFVLSPVFDPDVVDEAHRLRLLAVPGAGTAGELLAAHRHGATVVKFFPSGALGGPAFMRAVRGPLPDIAIIPTSGPTSENLAEYVAAGAVAVGVGSEVVSPGYTLDGIEAAARRVAAAMVAARAAR